MNNLKKTPPNRDELIRWSKNKLINPRSGRKIKLNGPTYKILIKFWNNIQGGYDPILMTKIPLIFGKPIFIFKDTWDPYSGIRYKNKDTSKYKVFDPDTLIHWFYIRRLNHLWIPRTMDGFHGFYGEAMGNAPDFFVRGRGKHPEWYLFRLPELDDYLMKNHNRQIPIIMPQLTDKEIENIYNCGLEYGTNFKKRFGYKRPNLIEMNIQYKISINKDLSIKENKKAIDILRNF